MPDSSNLNELNAIIKDNNEVIARIELQILFVNKKLMLTRHKLVYEEKSAFGATSVRSLYLEHLKNVTASAGPMFGMIHFSHDAPDFPADAGLFWRRDIITMKRITEGYLLAKKQGTNLSDIPVGELRLKLMELGTDDPAIKA